MEEKNSFSWARKRQIVVVCILVTFIIFATGAVYFWFFSQTPTCFDGNKNGGETGIDCGGKCAQICSGLAEDPVIEFTRLFKGLKGYSAIAHVENKNDFIAKDANYSFKLYDAKGALIGQRDGGTFIPQLSSIPIYESNIDTKGVEPAKVIFAFNGQVVWEKSDFVEPKLEVEDEKLSGEKTEPRLTANVINTTVRDVTNVEVTSVLYDDNGNAINASKTVVDKIGPNQSVPVTFTFPYPLPETIHACAQPVDVALIIDRSGSMASISSNPPQPLTDVKIAADYFIKQLNDKDQASIISFANTASAPIDQTLTTDISVVTKVIDGITIHTDGGQNTNIEDGLEKAYSELNSTRHSPNSDRAVVLLTDGEANLPSKSGVPSNAAEVALTMASTIKSAGISVFTIGLGKEVNKDFLIKIATTREDAFFAPTTTELTSIYQTIGIKICKRGTSRIEISPLVSIPN